jgi:hypothetical protein
MALFAVNYDSVNFEVPRFTNVVLCGTVAQDVARNAETLKNVHERMFAVAEDAGK